MVKSIFDKDIPITGEGTQRHFSLEWPSLEQAEATIEDYSDLGLDMMITDLDIVVLPTIQEGQGAEITMNAELSDSLYLYTDGLHESIQESLTHRYRDSITRITFWGVSDGDSWKNNWP